MWRRTQFRNISAWSQYDDCGNKDGVGFERGPARATRGIEGVEVVGDEEE